MGNVHMEAKDINYRGGEKKMSVEEAIKNAGNTGLAHTADIAPDFSAESAYNSGDLVYHNGTLYVFTSNHSAGAWSTDDTQAVTVGGEITSLMSGLNDYNKKAFIVTGHTHATQGMATWDTTGIDFTGRYPVAFYVVTDVPYYVSQAIEGMSVSMNATTHEPQLYLHATADAMWKDKDCFAVYI